MRIENAPKCILSVVRAWTANFDTDSIFLLDELGLQRCLPSSR